MHLCDITLQFLNRIDHILDWNLVKVFLAVCETGSQVRAASLTGLSHATVFRRIALLEEQMGAPLV